MDYENLLQQEADDMRVPDAFDYVDAEEEGNERADQPTRCNRCGSTDVRWRQQGGRWVLFSSTPGHEHVCPVNASSYGAVPEDD